MPDYKPHKPPCECADCLRFEVKRLRDMLTTALSVRLCASCAEGARRDREEDK